MLKRSRFIEWLRLWKPPARDQYGFWAGVASAFAAVGVGLSFADSLGHLVPAVGVICVVGAGYILLAILFGWKLPPTHADWEAYKLQRSINSLALRDVIQEVSTELDFAAGQLAKDLANGTYSGILLGQDKWSMYGVTIENDPVFADVRDVIETAYEAIRAHSKRSYEAAQTKISSRETEDLGRAIAEVDAARSAAAKTLSEL
jgi:hypothetical protein